jgi:hypothetical protein
MLMDHPPCWQDGPKQNPCALAHYNRVAHGHTELRADWFGWKPGTHATLAVARDSHFDCLAPRTQ